MPAAIPCLAGSFRIVPRLFALVVSSFTPSFSPLTLTLTGANTYTGGTTIGSTLQVGNGGTTGSIAGDVVFQGGSLIFNRSNNTTFGGDISGFGQLQQIGGGTLTFNRGQ